MRLAEQSIPINFSQGLDLKTDPFQIQVGKFLSLENSVFTKGGLLQKRNGFGKLTSLPDATSNFVTTFNGNLTAVGNKLEAYSQGSSTWVNKGAFKNIGVNTLPLVRSNTTQTQSDAVIASNGLVCVVYTDNIPSNGTTAASYKYSILDSTTGQNIVNPTVIPVSSGSITNAPRVFLLGNYFVIVFTNTIIATPHLQYVAISVANPTVVTANTDISAQYTPWPSLAFDGFVVNNKLFLAWNGNDGGGAIRVRSLTDTLVLSSTKVFAGRAATVISVCADVTVATPIIYITAYDNAGATTGATMAVDPSLNTILNPVVSIGVSPVLNLTSSAQNGSVLLFFEVSNSYIYDSSIPTNYFQTVSVTQAGVVGTPTTPVKSVGIASKSFILDGTVYLLAAYQSNYQPTYFLIDQLGNVSSKIAYQNGGGYLITGLPNISINDNVVSMPYLFRDLIEPVNKAQNATNAGQGVYAQTGVNFVSFTIGGSNISTAEIGQDLHLSGGFLWMYDGAALVEQNFFLYPDNVEVLAINSLTPLGTTTNTSSVITAVSSTANITVGMNISGAGIPAATTVVSFTSNTITISNPATATNVATALTLTGNMTNQQYFYQVIYSWTDNQGNIHRSAPSVPVSVTTAGANTAVKVFFPTLRLTYKTLSPVKIEIYRFSAGQQEYFQTTLIANPVLNDTTIDSLEYTDIHSDAQIVGNSLIYTTGGVVEDIGLSAVNSLTLYKSRMFAVSAEDTNLINFSKQVIQSTPVEMSDLFSIFVAPTIGSQGNTGPITALAAMDDKLIIFKRNAIYYITGTGPDITGANNDFSDPVFITATVGCSNFSSIVLMPNGIMFQSDKGIWLLGRDLSTQYIGAPVENFNQNTVVSALAVPGTNQVRFVLDNATTLMYDYYYGQWGTFVGIPNISSTLYQNLHTFINQYGDVYQETPGSYVDGSNPVLLNFTTGWLNLAGVQGFERAYDFFLLATYFSPHKLNVGVAYDYNSSVQQQSVITPTNQSPLYGDVSYYGAQPLYGGPPAREQWRLSFKKQKCQAFQISISEQYDSSYGVAPGAGFSMSGLNVTVGIKSSRPRLSAAQQVG